MTTFNIRKSVAYIYLLYAATTIFMPKIKIGFESAGVYFFEVLCIVLSFLLLLLGKLKFSPLEKSYFLYLFFSFLGWAMGWFFIGYIDLESLLILIKYSSFILLIPIAFYFGSFFTESHLKKILYSQVLFVVIAGGYTVFHTVTQPVSLSVLIGGYSQEYRLIGLTGHALTSNGLVEIGHTSVQMGVYVSILFLIFFSLYSYMRQSKYLIISLLLFFGTMLTYSRSGFLVLAVGLIYLIISNLVKRRVFGFVLVAGIVILFLSLCTNFINSLFNFGTLAKLSETGFSDAQRMSYWKTGVEYVLANPINIFFGSGYGTINYIVGFGTLESFFFDTLLESGIFALLFILLFFYYLWEYSFIYSRPFGSENFFKAVLHGYHLAIPGLFVACAVGGNSIQTDFIAPAFYLVLGICLFHIKYSRNENYKF
jgi:O-antigen ligase